DECGGIGARIGHQIWDSSALPQVTASALDQPKIVRAFEFRPLTSAPGRIPTALTAPEGVAPPCPVQRKRARGRPFWPRIGPGADNRRSWPCRPPDGFHKPGERPPREPYPAPGITHRPWRAGAQ